jgi:hypothetical protein
VAATGQRDEALRVCRDERLAEARRALGAREMRGAGQATQAAVAGHVARHQEEVRAQLARPHTAQILLPGFALPGRSQAFDRWSDMSAVSRWLQRQMILWRGCAGLAPPPGDHDASRVGRDRVEQLDLHADHGPQAHLLGRGRKSDGAVQALVVGQGDR